MKSIKQELRELNDPNLKLQFDEKIKNYNKTIEQLSIDLQFIPNKPLESKNPDTQTTDQLLQAATQIQKTDINKMNDLIRKTEVTKQVGSESLVSLSNQNEKIINVNNGLATVEENIGTANKNIKSIARRVATDKFLWCLTCLIVIAIILVVLAKLGYLK